MKCDTQSINLAVVGSVALDTIATPVMRRELILGGSASYACAAASFFTRAGMVGVVGDDFSDDNRAMIERFDIDTTGLQTIPGKTFRWSGVYENDMNRRRTLKTELNVFEEFAPILPAAYRKAPFLLLGNIAPQLQHHVLDQADAPLFVAADTMDLWIRGNRDALVALLPRINLLLLNDDEARLLTGCSHLTEAAQAIHRQGARYVLIKKGEHGCFLSGAGNLLLVPAFPLAQVADPTGAGDSFAGALLGSLAAAGTPDDAGLRNALLHATAAAAFCVEDFGLERLCRLCRDDIDERVRQLRQIIV